MTSDLAPERLESEDSKDSTSTDTSDQNRAGIRSLRTRRASKQSTDEAVTTAAPAPEGRIRTRLKSQFLEDFNPEESTRERRKLTRKPYATTRSILDDHGRYRDTGADLCDCLSASCIGCHFPCPSCGNSKCGFSCRVNRKWVVESIEYDGKDMYHENRNAVKLI